MLYLNPILLAIDLLSIYNLTLTNVVFEFLMLYIHLNNILYLTLTNVVFEL